MSELDLVRDLMPDGLPRPNLPLLKKVLDHIDAHPEEWFQGQWAIDPAIWFDGAEEGIYCGTAYCIAGHALVTEGYTITISPNHGSAHRLFDPSGERVEDGQFGVPFHCEARKVLGLTTDEAERLFDENNSRLVVQAEAELIAARAGERL